MAITESSRKIIAAWPEKGIPLTTAEAVSYGDLLGITSVGYVEPVDSDDAEHTRLVAGATTASGGTCPCYLWVIMEGFTGCTIGAALYPGATAGQLTETADTDSGDSDEIVGYALNATTVMILPSVRADSTAA